MWEGSINKDFLRVFFVPLFFVCLFVCLYGFFVIVLFCLLICFETDVIGWNWWFVFHRIFLTRVSCDESKEIRILFHVTCLYLPSKEYKIGDKVQCVQITSIFLQQKDIKLLRFIVHKQEKIWCLLKLFLLFFSSVAILVYIIRILLVMDECPS